jgi:nitroreductase
MEKTYHIESLIEQRWSPRAFSSEPLPEEKLHSLFYAASKAPSSFNSQPWRFIYSKKGSNGWKKMMDLLVEFNKGWAVHASYLVLILSRKFFEHNGKVARTSSFDTGAAWENLALEAFKNSIATHAMSGFDYDKARDVFKISDLYNIEAMVAIGYKGEKSLLPIDLQKEEGPKGRKGVNEFVSLDEFTFR